jgi:molecular chaperone DnaJ
MIDSPCADCRGEGRVTEDRTFTVEVPAGVENGSTLRLAGRGPAGWRGGPNGSLFVHLQVNDDPRFERVGNELHTALHVAMTQAALGADVELETLDGTETVTIAPGTQNGHIHRLRGLGVPHLRGRGRGDLHAHVVVDTPDGLSPEQQTLLRQLAEARGEAVGEHHGGVFSRIKSALS